MNECKEFKEAIDLVSELSTFWAFIENDAPNIEMRKFVEEIICKLKLPSRASPQLREFYDSFNWPYYHAEEARSAAGGEIYDKYQINSMVEKSEKFGNYWAILEEDNNLKILETIRMDFEKTPEHQVKTAIYKGFKKGVIMWEISRDLEIENRKEFIEIVKDTQGVMERISKLSKTSNAETQSLLEYRSQNYLFNKLKNAMYDAFEKDQWDFEKELTTQKNENRIRELERLYLEKEGQKLKSKSR